MSSSIDTSVGAGSAIPFNYTSQPASGVTNTDQVYQGAGTISYLNNGEVINNSTGATSFEPTTIGQFLQSNEASANPISSGTNSTTPATGTVKNSTTGGQGGVFTASFWTDIFLRAVVIITGFIFVAAGLRSFGNNQNAVVALKSTVGLGK